MRHWQYFDACSIHLPALREAIANHAQYTAWPADRFF
jgi:hypothetical protein